MKPLHVITAALAVALVAVVVDPGGASHGQPREKQAPSGDEQRASVPKRPARPLATVEGVEPHTSAQLLDLRRTGPKVVTVTLRISRGSSNVSLGWRPALEGPEGEYDTASGLRLIDEVNGREHFPLKDADGHCLCTNGIESLFDNQSLSVSAKFPAPPADVDRVSLHVPEFQSFDSILLGG